MALNDIHFQEAEGQDFVVEFPTGVLYSPLDILIDEESDRYLVMETSQSGGDIFIMND
ncbi:MAG: hypothetical protein KBC41_02225 [Candidatus Pacebacteria bacterium]|nr:hypothetical protein [Candidatus Paceibacterota bacterium]MBP9866871.1 hypothetical protein [Candidatus Paceibacterota bacterium]